ncbi:hypothetical protein CPC08DRAFT_770631 [Agrocybe pediades]|nr:hypothetical protein CPC08DRAFT_770631 [Agrocybe pediades]
MIPEDTAARRQKEEDEKSDDDDEEAGSGDIPNSEPSPPQQLAAAQESASAKQKSTPILITLKLNNLAQCRPTYLADAAAHVPQTKDTALKKNPIHYFYREVERGADGKLGNVGDKHFKCYHGNQRIITLTKSMKYNLTTLINHLKADFPLMFKLFTILKARSPTEAITQEEMDVASGKKKLDAARAKTLRSSSTWFDNLELASQNLKEAFEQQANAAAGPWDQAKFEDLLAKWIVACDQPFDEVDKQEFRDLLFYIHHPASSLNIPHRDASNAVSCSSARTPSTPSSKCLPRTSRGRSFCHSMHGPQTTIMHSSRSLLSTV